MLRVKLTIPDWLLQALVSVAAGVALLSKAVWRIQSGRCSCGTWHCTFLIEYPDLPFAAAVQIPIPTWSNHCFVQLTSCQVQYDVQYLVPRTDCEGGASLPQEPVASSRELACRQAL